MTDGVVFLPSYHEAIKDLPESDRLKMYDAIVSYGLYGEIIELPAVLRSMFTLIKPNIDSSQNRYRAAKKNGSLPPKEGSNPRGRPMKNQTENQNKNHTENQKQNQDSDTDSDFDRPTFEEVKVYCKEIGSNADPEKFYSYYSDKGWKTGADIIRDWKAVFRRWSSDQKPKRQFSTAAEYKAPTMKKEEFNLNLEKLKMAGLITDEQITAAKRC